MPDFLRLTASLLEYSRNLAFVQTPQLYANQDVSMIAKGAALQQSIFFENICEGKSASNAMFCCGTNFVMRTHVLKEVGGFDERSVTEDFATSVQIHARGYRSLYYSHARVFGMAPETLSAYFKQQYRWSGGTVGVVRRLATMMRCGELTLNRKQRWEYFLSATYYFTGWSFFILILCPALYLLFNIPTYFSSPYFYIATFVPYYFFTIITFYLVMRERHYSFKNIYIGTIMSSLIFPVLMQSTIAGLFNRKMVFHITNKGKGEVLPLWALWPWIMTMMLLTYAIIKGIGRYPENHYAIGINIFWCVYHVLLLMNIFRFNTLSNVQEVVARTRGHG